VAGIPKIVRLACYFVHVCDHKPAGRGLSEKVAKFFKQGRRFMEGALFPKPEVREDPIQAAKFGQALGWENAGIPGESPSFAGEFCQVAHLWHSMSVPEVQTLEGCQCEILNFYWISRTRQDDPGCFVPKDGFQVLQQKARHDPQNWKVNKFRQQFKIKVIGMPVGQNYSVQRSQIFGEIQSIRQGEARKKGEWV